MQRQYAFSKIVLCALVVLLSVMNVFEPLMGNSIVATAVTALTLLSFFTVNAWNGLLYSNKIVKLFLLLVVTWIYTIATSIIGKNASTLTRAQIICYCALLTGFCAYYHLKEKSFLVLKVYCLVMMVSGAYYMVVYAEGGAYEYALKNNFSPMLLSSVIIIFFLRKKLFKRQLFAWAMLIFQMVVIFSTKCRSVALTTLILIVACALYYVYTNVKSGKLKGGFILTFTALTVLIVSFWNQIWETVYNGLRLGILEESGAEKYSANRLPMIEYGLEKWTDSFRNFIIGAESGTYVECFYIDTLTYRGIIGVTLFVAAFITILVMLGKELNRLKDKDNQIVKMGLGVFVASLFIALFEAGAPFVQGSTYFIVWFCVGIAFAYPVFTEKGAEEC